MKYSGIDLHSNNSVVTITDEEDRVMAEALVRGQAPAPNSPVVQQIKTPLSHKEAGFFFAPKSNC